MDSFDVIPFLLHLVLAVRTLYYFRMYSQTYQQPRKLFSVYGLLLSFLLVVAVILVVSIQATRANRISLVQSGHEYRINQLHQSISGVRHGDLVKKIDGVNINQSPMATKNLVISNARSLQVQRGQHVQTVKLPSQSVFSQSLIMAGIGLGIFLSSSLALYRRRYSNQERYLRLFAFFLALGLMSIVPSSVGNWLGRLWVIVFMSTLPMIIRKLMVSANIRSILGFITLGFAYFNPLLYLAVWFNLLPNWSWLINYLNGWGIFVLPLGLLMAVFYEEQRQRATTQTKVNLALVLVVSLLPLYFLYLYPIVKVNLSFEGLILFLVFLVVGVIHTLIVRRQITNLYHLPSWLINSLMLVIVSGVIYLLGWLLMAIPIWLGVVYLFIFLLAMRPFLQEYFMIMMNSDNQRDLSIFKAVEAEREQLATMIHDTTIQEVILAKRRIGESDSRVNVTLDDVIYELRSLCTRIYPLFVDQIGVSRSITKMLSDLQKQLPVEIQWDQHSNLLESLDPQVGNFLVRSIQENIINGIKHGQANQFDICCFDNGHQLNIQMVDNGHGEMKIRDQVGHYGLSQVQAKLTMLGGYLKKEKIAAGNRVTLVIPMREK